LWWLRGSKLIMDVKRFPGLFALLLIAAPFAVGAQNVSTATPAGGYTYRLSPDGEFLAAVPTDGSDRGAYLLLAPLQPSPETSQQVATGVAGILTLPLGETSRVSVGANQQWILSRPTTSVAPWCNQLGAWQALAGNPGDCVAPGVNPSELQPDIGRRQFDLAYSTERFDLALAYGVTNLGAGGAAWSFPGVVDDLSSLSGSGVLPEPGLGTGLATLGKDVALSGTWRWTPGSALSVTAGVGQSSLVGPHPIPLEFEHAALGVGLSRGAFSGRLTGRVTRPNTLTGLDQPWAGLDIGIAWRTPWRGELSFGARNLITRGADPTLSDPSTTELEQAVTRTPYVQYKQDL